MKMKREGKSNFLLSTESRLQKTLSEIFTKSSFSLNNRQIFVSVLYVDLSPDLKNAKVYIDTFGLENDKDKHDLLKQLNKGFIKQVRGIIASKVRMKYIPEISFFYDNSSEKSARINAIIDGEIKKMGLK